MKLLDELRSVGISFKFDQDRLYEEAYRELQSGDRKEGLWIKALTQCGMDETEASSVYISLRVDLLRSEISEMLFEMHREKSEFLSMREKEADAALQAARREIEIANDNAARLIDVERAELLGQIESIRIDADRKIELAEKMARENLVDKKDAIIRLSQMTDEYSVLSESYAFLRKLLLGLIFFMIVFIIFLQLGVIEFPIV